MPDIYIAAAQALLLCDKAEAKIAEVKPASFAGNYIEVQASSAVHVKAAIAHIKQQIEAAKIFVEEDDISVCITSHQQDALAWALNKLTSA